MPCPAPYDGVTWTARARAGTCRPPATTEVSVSVDAGPCLNDGDKVACGGLILGSAGLFAGAGSLGVAVYERSFGATEGSKAVETALGVQALLLGGTGTSIDAIGEARGPGGVTSGTAGGCEGW